MAAPMTEAQTIQILTDENVGSHLIRATTEAWREGVATLRAEGNDTTADAVTAMLRSASSNPSPGEVIEIEIMPGTDSESTLDAVSSAFPSEIEQENGDYSRKTQTARKTTAKSSNGTAKSSGKKKGTPRECRCGCGETTGGGTFRPGHDARFKGQMLRLIDEGGEEGETALEALKEFPNLYNYEQARDRLGSGPTKREAKAKAMEELKAKKAAEAEAAAASTEDDADAEVEEEEAVEATA